jgi:hypothetical protein
MNKILFMVVLLMSIFLLAVSNWPSIVKQYFPYNLLFSFIGGCGLGWCITYIICKYK